MWNWILTKIVGRTIVRERAAEAATITLIERLKELRFFHAHRISEPVASAVIQEALRRAAAEEKDGQPRSDKFLAQIDVAAKAIIAIFDGDSEADTRIRSILSFHNLP